MTILSGQNYWGQVKQHFICCKFPVTINNNNTISVWHRSYHFPACQKHILTNAHIQRKWCQWQQSWSSQNHYMYPWISKKFQQQFIVCKHLLWPIILRVDFSDTYLIGIDWFSTNQLLLHWGPLSSLVLDPTLFPLWVKISTLPPPHKLVKMSSQDTIPSRTLVIVPTTFNSTPEPDCYYNFTEMPQKPQ